MWAPPLGSPSQVCDGCYANAQDIDRSDPLDVTGVHADAVEVAALDRNAYRQNTQEKFAHDAIDHGSCKAMVDKGPAHIDPGIVDVEDHGHMFRILDGLCAEKVRSARGHIY